MRSGANLAILSFAREVIGEHPFSTPTTRHPSFILPTPTHWPLCSSRSLWEGVKKCKWDLGDRSPLGGRGRSPVRYSKNIYVKHWILFKNFTFLSPIWAIRKGGGQKLRDMSPKKSSSFFWRPPLHRCNLQLHWVVKCHKNFCMFCVECNRNCKQSNLRKMAV